MTDILVVATGNPGKVKEFELFFKSLGPLGSAWELQCKPDDLEIVETGTTFAENAVLKARSVASAMGQWAIADDSGLAVDALGGAPGVYSARYAPTVMERNAKLLQELAGVAERGAAFICAIALCRPNGTVAAEATGCRRGEILTVLRGSGGFGYDPLFYVPEAGSTFADMTPAQKQQWSHRGLALRQLARQLATLDRTAGQ